MNQLRSIAHVFLRIATPFLLILTAIQLLILPWFIHFQYNFPGFPEDTYGFTKAERIQYGLASLKYLNSFSDADNLENLTFENGDPFYNEREISHMLDVKILMQQARIVWLILVILFVIIFMISRKDGSLEKYSRSLQIGGWITLGIIAMILLGVFTGFNQLFTVFHQIFYEGDTWLFFYTDSLIRLFPLFFWELAFISMGVLTVLGAVVFIIAGWLFNRRALSIGLI